MSRTGHLRSFSAPKAFGISEVMLSPDFTSGKIIKAAQMPYPAQMQTKRK